jgi:hypothetical protein
MANTFYLKKGDTYPNIETILSDSSGPVDLTGSTVDFIMSVANTGNLMIDKPANIVLPQTGGDIGKVYAEFETGDTDALGTYRVEWRVTFSNGKIATFPRGQTDNFNEVIVD